jgi:hypothetical protein
LSDADTAAPLFRWIVGEIAVRARRVHCRHRGASCGGRRRWLLRWARRESSWGKGLRLCSLAVMEKLTYKVVEKDIRPHIE